MKCLFLNIFVVALFVSVLGNASQNISVPSDFLDEFYSYDNDNNQRFTRSDYIILLNLSKEPSEESIDEGDGTQFLGTNNIQSSLEASEY